jgi:hypothetical protein
MGIRHRISIPPLVLHAEGTHLRVRYRHDNVAVEYVESGHYDPPDTVPMQLELLAEIEGRDDSPGLSCLTFGSPRIPSIATSIAATRQRRPPVLESGVARNAAPN